MAPDGQKFVLMHLVITLLRAAACMASPTFFRKLEDSALKRQTMRFSHQDSPSTDGQESRAVAKSSYTRLTSSNGPVDRLAPRVVRGRGAYRLTIASL